MCLDNYIYTYFYVCINVYTSKFLYTNYHLNSECIIFSLTDYLVLNMNYSWQALKSKSIFSKEENVLDDIFNH